MRKIDSPLVLVALPLGSILWLLLYGIGKLSQGAGALVRALVYLAPLGASTPFAVRFARKDRFGSGLMLIALTPLLSMLNLVVFIGLSGSVTGGPARHLLAAVGLFVLWQAGWLVPLVRARRDK